MVRRTWLAVLVASLLLAMTSGSISVAATAASAASVPGRVLLGVTSTHAAAAALTQISGGGGGRVVEFRPDANVYVVAVPGHAPAWAASLRRLPGVRYAEPDYLAEVFETVPDDPSWPDLWGMRAIGAPTAWDESTGSSDIVVGVVDTGVDLTHTDLVARLWENPGEIPGNGIDDDGNGWPDDVNGADCAANDGDPMDDDGHGTHVAGTIGAAGNDGVGVVGVNWDVRIMALKVFKANGSASYSDIAECIDYATERGVTISNHSYGGAAFSQTLEDAFARARSAGHLTVVAAGNAGWDIDQIPVYPAAFDLDNVITVAATDIDDLPASFTNSGAVSVDMGAPGVAITSTLPGGYGVSSGTSMSAPHVAGAAALLASTVPGASAAFLRDTLLATTTPVPSLAGLVATGGRLDVAAALDAAIPGGPPSVTAPTFTFPVNKQARSGGADVVARWWGADPDGIAAWELQRSTNGEGSWTTMSLFSSTALTKTSAVSLASPSYVYRVRATDPDGATSTWATAAAFRLRYAQENDPALASTGSWITTSTTAALGGATRYASAVGASVSYVLPAGSRAFAVVAARRSNAGYVDIFVDGIRRARIDLYASSTSQRKMVFAAVVGAGSHAVRLEVVGAKRKASSGTRVELDAFAVLGP